MAGQNVLHDRKTEACASPRATRAALRPEKSFCQTRDVLRRDPRAALAIDRLGAWLHAPAGEASSTAPSDMAAFVADLLPPRWTAREGSR